MPKVKRLYRATITRTYKDWYADEEKTQTMTRHLPDQVLPGSVGAVLG